MIDVWINNGSSWIIELTEYEYINISTYRPLLGSSHMDLPVELRSPRKGLINIKNEDKKNVFYGLLLDILIFQVKIQKELKKLINELLKNLIMIELNFM